MTCVPRVALGIGITRVDRAAFCDGFGNENRATRQAAFGLSRYACDGTRMADEGGSEGDGREAQIVSEARSEACSPITILLQ